MFALSFFLGTSLSWAVAPEVLFQGTIQGGIAVDGSGVATLADGSDAWFRGPDFQLAMPNTATVTAVWLVLTSKNDGFRGNETETVRVNGVALSEAVRSSEGTRYLVYELNPSRFGIDAEGAVRYEESSAAELGDGDGAGVGGATLAAVYDDTRKATHRHAALLAGYGSAAGTEWSIGGLPTQNVAGEMQLGVGVAWECADEQDGSVGVNGVVVGTEVGGRDDGDEPGLPCMGDWNSLWTVGSFGTDADGWPVGVDGDDPWLEPAGGTGLNSRWSDELFTTDYDKSGRFTLNYSAPSADAWVGLVSVVIDLDGDADGVIDALDPCTDVDGDGFGNPDYPAECEVDCDDADPSVGAPYGYADEDGDGYGSTSDYACEARDGFVDDASDCDDTNAAINPEAVETCDRDAIDENCDGYVNDDDPMVAGTTAWFPDADHDGFGAESGSVPACETPPDHVADNTDCNDASGETYPGAYDPPNDGVDQNCDGADESAGTLTPPAPDECECASVNGSAWGAFAALIAALRRVGPARKAARSGKE